MSARRGKRKGRLFVVTAPSGAGKTSLIDAVMRADPSLKISVSYTTRSPRPGEKEGIDYRFVDPDEDGILAPFGKGKAVAHFDAPGPVRGPDRERFERVLGDLVACRQLLDNALKDGCGQGGTSPNEPVRAPCAAA